MVERRTTPDCPLTTGKLSTVDGVVVSTDITDGRLSPDDLY
jgi:hypothetical protein